jgi:hypothetical protein
MKNIFGKPVLALALFAILMTACKDKSAEKRIAELESRLAEMEAKKANDPTAAVADPASTPAAADVKPEGPLPVMQFETMEHDFGKINEGDIVEYTYKFKNTGDAPLIIQGAQGSCGCTVPNWTKEPIPAGGSGVVTAKFDSHGKQNAQSKTVTVTANTWPKLTVLRFNAMVNPKASTDLGPVKK